MFCSHLGPLEQSERIYFDRVNILDTQRKKNHCTVPLSLRLDFSPDKFSKTGLAVSNQRQDFIVKFWQIFFVRSANKTFPVNFSEAVA